MNPLMEVGGYYDFRAQTKQPSGSSISFVNATGLIALKDASAIGVDVPQRMVTRAVAAIIRQRLPDHSYLYGEYLKNRPRAGINRPAGSLGRSNACNYALELWGDDAVNHKIHMICLDRLFSRNGWLTSQGKGPFHMSLGSLLQDIFFYYGHLYASFCLENFLLNIERFTNKKWLRY